MSSVTGISPVCVCNWKRTPRRGPVIIATPLTLLRLYAYLAVRHSLIAIRCWCRYDDNNNNVIITYYVIIIIHFVFSSADKYSTRNEPVLCSRGECSPTRNINQRLVIFFFYFFIVFPKEFFVVVLFCVVIV